MKREIIELKTKYNVVPAIGVILVGNRKDSQMYVKMKRNVAEEVGMKFFLNTLNEDISQEELLKVLHNLNKDDNIHGILVQLPLPAQLNEAEILDNIDLLKDVDGFHPLNVGALASIGKNPYFIPCTARGCMELLDQINFNLQGKNVTIIGTSNIVGLPLAMLCLKRQATVTICHAQTNNLAENVKRSHVVIAACGQPRLVVNKIFSF